MKRLSYASVVLAVLALVLFNQSCSSSSNSSSETETETLAGFEIKASDTVTVGLPFTVSVSAVGDQGTIPFTSFNGSVILAASNGSLDPWSFQLSKGEGSDDIVLSCGGGPQTLTASNGENSGSILLNAELFDALPGDSGALAADNIPNFLYHADATNFSAGHSDLGTMPLSFNNLAIQFELGTTVGEANTILGSLGAGIVGGFPGQGGVFPGILMLKINSSSHIDMENALDGLRSNPKVLRVVQDALVFSDRISRKNEGDPPSWEWQTEPNGDNWNLERIRVPQMWNLNNNIEKEGNWIETVVIDSGFLSAHEDVMYDVWTTGRNRRHGTMVSSVLGAIFDNGKGVDGINPFAHIKARTLPYTTSDDVYEDAATSAHAMLSDLLRVLVDRPDIRVINMSLGYNWSQISDTIDPTTDTGAQTIAETQGEMLATALGYLDDVQQLPLIVVSAGNDSYGRANLAEQLAMYNSPMANAALSQGVSCILVVEALMNEPLVTGGVLRAAFSEINGNISAPGQRICTGSDTPTYDCVDGTSFASPQVAGLAGYILALDQNLTTADLREMLLSNANSVPDASPCIDAWASVMDIDRIRGDNKILKALCDIDDGTMDGNKRVDLEAGTDFTEEDSDGDGGRGDGEIDMSDFRRLRDWFIQLGGSELDGSPDHLKKDLNGDGEVGSAGEENIYPLGDFNGDGILDLSATSYVPGAVGTTATDLEVFKSVFSDPDYDSADLDDLMESVDIDIDATRFFVSESPSTILTSRIKDAGTGDLLHEQDHTAADPELFVTVPYSEAGYDITLALSNTLEEQEFGDVTFDLDIGDDVLIDVVASIKLDPTATFLHTCEDNANDSRALLLSSFGIKPGDVLLLESSGVLAAGGGYTGDEIVAVFSANNTLLTETELHRVPGAIDAGNAVYTVPAWNCEGEPRDIPEDFTVDDVAIIIVPDGAIYLFVAPLDVLYEDNSDPNDEWRFVISIIHGYNPSAVVPD